MTVEVAIATEFDDYDGEVFRVLLEAVLGQPVRRWKSEIRFNGDRSVRKIAPVLVRHAMARGVSRFLFAVDNDGGARRRLEHDATHHEVEQARDERDGCRWCWLSSAAPVQPPAARCIAVPVQTMETWLLHARGDELTPTPEQVYDRAALKKRFFGRPLPPTDVRLARALGVLEHADALARLRGLRSFQRFETDASILGSSLPLPISPG